LQALLRWTPSVGQDRGQIKRGYRRYWIVHHRSAPVALQEPAEGLAGEQAAPSESSGQALVGVEDLQLSLAQCLLQGLDTKAGIQGVGPRLHRGQATTYRLYHSMMATRYRKSRAMGR